MGVAPMSMAKVVISGTVASQPEKRFTNNTNQAVTNFTLSVPVPPGPSGQSSGKTFMVRVTCWRALADAAESLQKGQAVLVEGKLQINSFQSPDGVQKKTFEIDAQNVAQLSELPQLLATSPATAGGSSPTPSTSRPAAQPAPAMATVAAGNVAPMPSFDGMTTEDDIPF
jgi:single-strand DNA-binding protein